MSEKPGEWASGRRPGKMTAVLLDFIDRVKSGQATVIHGPKYVVMDRETFESFNLGGRESLLARAELLDEMAKHLMGMIATHGEKCADLERGYGLCDAAADAKKVLTAYASLPKMPEHGKNT